MDANATAEDAEGLLTHILMLHDYADNMIAATRLKGVMNEAEQLALATPVVTQSRYSADILGAFYREVAFKGRTVTPDIKDVLETAIRTVFETLQEFADAAEALVKAKAVPDEIDPTATTVLSECTVQLPAGEPTSQ